MESMLFKQFMSFLAQCRFSLWRLGCPPPNQYPSGKKHAEIERHGTIMDQARLERQCVCSISRRPCMQQNCIYLFKS